MAGKNKGKKDKLSVGVAAQNRRARHDFLITETVEAGLMLRGSEVKSLREGKASIAEAYAAEEGGELWLLNAYIPEYSGASAFGHEPRSKRKLLVHRRELAKLTASTERKGMSLVPLKIYFNDRGIAKVTGPGRGQETPRQTTGPEDRDWGRQKARLMREQG